METELTCAVCADIYLEGKREPVTLPECGHTFCRPCLLNLDRTGNLSCPYCRTKHDGQPVSEISTVYALLNLTKYLRRSKFGVCEAHGSTLDFWCQTCHSGLCGYCLYESHSKYDHKVVIMKNAIEEKKTDIRKTGVAVLEDINDDKILVMREIQNCLARVSDLCDHAKSLTSSGKNVKDLMADVDDSLNIEMVINVLDKMKGFGRQSSAVLSDNVEAAALALTDHPEGSSTSARAEKGDLRNEYEDSASDSPHTSGSRVTEQFSVQLKGRFTSTSSSDTDTDEETTDPSASGATAAMAVDLRAECKRALKKNILRHRRATVEFRHCNFPSLPSTTVAMLRRNCVVRSLSVAEPSSSIVNESNLVLDTPTIATNTATENSPEIQPFEASQSGHNDMASSEEGTDTTASVGWLLWAVKGDDGRDGRLRWEDERLHLYTLTEEIFDAHVTIKLPVILSLLQDSPEVFMDLGVDGVRFGRIYIRIWGELRRAQHFLTLCTGALGPSYKGSRCSKVEGKDKPGECLRVNHYVAANGVITSRGLMEGLEWSGGYSAIKREGLVVAASGGKGEYDGCFDICTRGNPVKKFSCPFGEVVSGLEVVKKATRHDPIGDLAIMNTGVVVVDRK